ncbi:MAG: dUTP diphosphatase, partial [Bacteroidota bacterium]|nr:dUTP diphosphatase [Bacteroidota bacterium]
IIARHEQISWIESLEISNTLRGSGGYGSTGTK